MKVKKLIRLLQRLSPEVDVYVPTDFDDDGEGDCWQPWVTLRLRESPEPLPQGGPPGDLFLQPCGMDYDYCEEIVDCRPEYFPKNDPIRECPACGEVCTSVEFDGCLNCDYLHPDDAAEEEEWMKAEQEKERMKAAQEKERMKKHKKGKSR